MKTKIPAYLRKISFILSVIILFLGLCSAKAQTPLTKGLPSPYNVPPFTSELVQYDFGGIHRFGMGITLPQAKFHIQVPSPLTGTPIFVVETPTVGSIKHLFTNSDGSISYGIYQSGYSLNNYFEGSNNYFEGSIGSHSGLYFDGPGTGILIKYSEPFSFGFQFSPSGPIQLSIEIYHDKLKVYNLMECNNFLLHDNAGSGKVLVSDNIGNGKWTDASGFLNDFWQLINNNVCLNTKYNNVGIGTDRPAQKLHVLDGNILISRSPIQTKAPGSKNGSVLFGDFITEKSTLGEWGIEYYTGNDDYASNGLNFWKPFSSGNGGGNDYLYLRNDGDIGIGTEKTCGYKLAVKGKILCTELKVQLVTDWCDYVFDKSYKLRPLHDVETFISTNLHLPDVPSADEVKTNGLNVGEMNVVLLKKIEELTLYAIEQQKQINNQQKQIDELKSAIQSK